MDNKKVILISGKLQSGKNQFAQFIFDKLKNYTNLSCAFTSFANPVKEGSRDDFKSIYDFINEVVDNCIQDLSKSSVDNFYFYKIMDLLSQLKIEEKNFFEDKTKLSRLFLQVYGTEIFRNRVDNNYWASKCIDDIKKKNDNVHLITDVRFLNEIELFKKEELDIITIRINRPMNREDATNEHVSEKQLDNYTHWDYIIENNFGLEELQLEADNIVLDLVR
jgi:hypothetical protein